ncbi:MAG: methionyl-tRNA formyltransferase [Lachnospiraceae bacterium]|nr:methionyl-tRNA formyltransferase [Ruminococcus sp.]MCM1273890.1 methionyl-tRNA formyltransferase [Lachnospiraceae bacterium]
MKLVFMGTPEFSVHTLEVLKAVGNDIRAVFTQPDKPKNRGKQITTSPVKDFAAANGIPVYQPHSLRKGEDAEEALRVLGEIAPDAIVVVAYGQILPKEILELPKYGCINAHASLLPKYRGAAPIQRCIQDGETETSLCTMLMDEGLDTGDILMRRDVAITPEMTGTELSAILSDVSGELVAETLVRLENGTAARSAQTYCREPSYAQMITKEELNLDFTQPAKRVHDFIRAMADVPCSYTFLDGKRLKVYRSRLTERTSKLPAGTVADAKTFAVACGDGVCVELTEVQPEGGKRMPTDAFLRGKKLSEGTVLGKK